VLRRMTDLDPALLVARYRPPHDRRGARPHAP
jgi:hypothetical protein